MAPPQSLSSDALHAHSSTLSSKVILITGAASGIGKAFSLLAAREGARMVLADRDFEGVSRVAKDIENAGGKAIAVKCDVTKWDEQVQLFERGTKEWGRIDVVIPNAGVGEVTDFHALSPSADGTLSEPKYPQLWINYLGVLYTTHLALTYLPRTPGPKSLILLGSVASYFGLPYGALYGSTKHAVRGLFLSLLPQLHHSSISSTLISPFFVDTPILDLTARTFVANMPKAKLEDVVGALVWSTSAPEEQRRGREMVVDPNGVVAFRADREIEEGEHGIYAMLVERGKALSWLQNLGRTVAWIQWRNCLIVLLVALLFIRR
ncbi:NAD(P)-binding protein [Atractiella rhizophila]|nr:NAD(P)-binding protein [Atractiella rhizophila]